MNRIKLLMIQYKNIIAYLFFGICTTIVNIVVFWGVAHRMGFKTLPSTIIAWFVAVFFAYLTNRRWVFDSQAKGKTAVFKELLSFIVCRLTTGVVDWGCMGLFVDIMGINDILMKLFANILVIILNYIASKYIIFKKWNG